MRAEIAHKLTVTKTGGVAGDIRLGFGCFCCDSRSVFRCFIRGNSVSSPARPDRVDTNCLPDYSPRRLRSGWQSGLAGQSGVFCRIAQLTAELAGAARMSALKITGRNGCMGQSGRVVREDRRACEKVHSDVTGSRLWAGSNRMSEILRRPTQGGVVSNHTDTIRFDESRASGITRSANRL